MNIDPGACRSCGGPLQIIDANDSSLTVACAECCDTYCIEPIDAGTDCLIDLIPQHFPEDDHGSVRHPA